MKCPTITAAVADPDAFASSGQWIGVVIGIVTALIVSLTKSAVRPVANIGSAGMAAPVLSTAEDITSVGLVFVSLLLPLLVLVALAVVAAAVFQVWRWRRRRRPEAQT